MFWCHKFKKFGRHTTEAVLILGRNGVDADKKFQGRDVAQRPAAAGTMAKKAFPVCL
jgi:hypothetical protein